MRAQVEDGQIFFAGRRKGIFHGGFECADGSDGAVLNGQVCTAQPCSDQRGTDHMQIAGDRASQIRLRDKFLAGDEQRPRSAQAKSRGADQNQHGYKHPPEFAHEPPSFPYVSQAGLKGRAVR